MGNVSQYAKSAIRITAAPVRQIAHRFADDALGTATAPGAISADAAEVNGAAGGGSAGSGCTAETTNR